MVGGDEPQLQVQVVVTLLHADEVEDVVVLHAAHAVDLVLVLPGELVLQKKTGRFRTMEHAGTWTAWTQMFHVLPSQLDCVSIFAF